MHVHVCGRCVNIVLMCCVGQWTTTAPELHVVYVYSLSFYSHLLACYVVPRIIYEIAWAWLENEELM